MQVALLQHFMEEPVLPKLLAHGQLPQPIAGLNYACVTTPLGVHMEEHMGPQLLSVMEQLARGLERLAKGKPGSGRRGMVHR